MIFLAENVNLLNIFYHYYYYLRNTKLQFSLLHLNYRGTCLKDLALLCSLLSAASVLKHIFLYFTFPQAIKKLISNSSVRSA